MTFHDDYHNNSEIEAYKSVKFLQVWLGTIAPVTDKLSSEVRDKLLEICKELEWPIVDDEYIGEILK